MRTVIALKSRLLVLSVVFCFLPTLPAALILYDGFDYPAGQALAGQGQQSYSWGTNRWLRTGFLSGETDWTIFSNSLTHPSVPSSGGQVCETNISRGANYERKFSPVSFQNGDTIWFSFLVKVTEPTLWNLFLNSAGINANEFGVEAGPNISIRPRLGVGYTSTENIVLGLNTTRLVVGRFRYFTSAVEQLDLWVDPDTAVEPQPGGVSTSNHIVHLREHDLQPAGIDSVLLEERSNGSVAFDELRVGTTWSDVVPPGTNGVVIRRIAVQDGQIQLDLSRLVPGATATVERASRLVAPVDWQEVGSFVPSTSFTNWTQTAPAENSFYRVRRP
jgi:hypothetical protein